MDISKLPYWDFVIHRKLMGAHLRYIVPARGAGKSPIRWAEDGTVCMPTAYRHIFSVGIRQLDIYRELIKPLIIKN